jgi:hypothetical protein
MISMHILGPARQGCTALTITLPLGPIPASASTKRFLEVELALNVAFIISEGPHRKLGGKREVIVRKRGSSHHCNLSTRSSVAQVALNANQGNLSHTLHRSESADSMAHTLRLEELYQSCAKAFLKGPVKIKPIQGLPLLCLAGQQSSKLSSSTLGNRDTTV